LSALLTIAVLADSTDLFPLLGQYLDAERYICQNFTSQSGFLEHVEAFKHELDCLLFCSEQHLLTVVNYLYDRGLVLPVVTIRSSDSHRSLHHPDVANAQVLPVSRQSYMYHLSEVTLAVTDLSEIAIAIDKAIEKFLSLTPIMPISNNARPAEIEIEISKPKFLLQQQQRLAEKLRERLGYLAVYYKRNPRQFFRNLDPHQKQELLSRLNSQYRRVVLDYFQESSQTNDKIDEFISSAFFSDISVSEIVKMHMELMEEFSKQLKLEGRNEDILLDYRLTLIDIIAHLCEMYRRSVPRETL
jgi:circadian clock protein KaiA